MKLLHIAEAEEIMVTGRGTILTSFGPGELDYREAQAGDLVEYPADIYRLVTAVEMSGRNVGGLIVRHVDWTSKQVLPNDYVAAVSLKDAMHYVSELHELASRGVTIYSYQMPVWLLPAYQQFIVGKTLYTVFGRSVAYPHDLRVFLNDILYHNGLPYTVRYRTEAGNGLELKQRVISQQLTQADETTYWQYRAGHAKNPAQLFCLKYGIIPPAKWCWAVEEGVFMVYELED